MLHAFNLCERALTVLALVLLFAALGACGISERSRSAQEEYVRARDRFQVVQAEPERFTFEEVKRAADDYARAMVELGDASAQEVRDLGGELLGVGAAGGAGGYALVALGARLLQRLLNRKAQRGTAQRNQASASAPASAPTAQLPQP